MSHCVCGVPHCPLSVGECTPLQAGYIPEVRSLLCRPNHLTGQPSVLRTPYMCTTQLHRAIALPRYPSRKVPRAAFPHISGMAGPSAASVAGNGRMGRQPSLTHTPYVYTNPEDSVTDTQGIPAVVRVHISARLPCRGSAATVRRSAVSRWGPLLAGIASDQTNDGAMKIPLPHVQVSFTQTHRTGAPSRLGPKQSCRYT